MAARPAAAFCPYDGTYNLDSDAYATGPLGGCPPLLDCDDDNPDVHPSYQEVLGDGIDADCDGLDTLRRYLSVNQFFAAGWSTTGTVSFPAGDLLVGTMASPASSARRTFGVAQPQGFSGMMVDVEGAGGSACSVTLTTGFAGVPGGTPHTEALPTYADTAWLEFGSVNNPHVIKSVEFACPAASYAKVDWFVVQNAEADFPPVAELSVDWHDTRTPGGGYTSTVVRSDDNRYIYMGSDVAGVARVDSWTGEEWSVAFGTGEDTLALAGVMAVGDLLPEPSGTGLYALMGDPVERGSDIVHGGLYFSPDRGDTWTQLADSYNATADADPPEDDIAGTDLLSQCPRATGSTSRAFKFGGGHLLQGDWFAGGEVLYIANADPDARGVSVYDAATGDVCPMAHTGAALPAQPVAGVLRVDVEPGGTPALVVGYVGRSDGGPGLYVCELPAGGMDCTGATSAACEAVPGSEGVDVRDLQLDEWLAEDLDTAVLVADAGNRPVDGDGDGIGDAACTIDDPGIDLLDLDDTWAGTLVVDYARVADDGDLPAIASHDLTGLSVDPGASYVFANVPTSGGNHYDADRMYRVERPDMALGFSWTPLNSETDDGPAGPQGDEIWSYDARELVRASNVDAPATWLEEGFIGVPSVFPARVAPGTGHDTEWLGWTLADETALAVVSTGMNAWLVYGLDSAWVDDDLDGTPDSEEETYWWFLPDTNGDEHSTYQTLVVHEAAPDSEGWIWQAAADHGLVDYDANVPQQAGALRTGSEVDCLWNDGFTAGATSVSVGTDGSVWVTLLDQFVSGTDPEEYYPHAGGVIRYAYSDDFLDPNTGLVTPGWYWTFAAGGYLQADDDAAFAMDWSGGATTDTYRTCGDQLLATRFSAPMDENLPSPFSSNDPYVTAESLGLPREVRAIDSTSALVSFTPTSVVGTDSLTYDTAGGLYATVTSGVALPGDWQAWMPVPFDGAYAIPGTSLTGSCGEADTYDGARIELVRVGADSYAHDADGDGIADDLDLDGFPDDFLFDVVVAVPGADTLVSEGGVYYYPCALARVQVGDDGAGGLGADWEWIPLRKHTEPYSGTECAVNGRNIAGAIPSPWADELYVWGEYYRDPYSGGGDPRRGGGACAVDLDSYDTTMVVDPSAVDGLGNTLYEFGIGALAPHPQVSDVLAILPSLDVVNWQQCTSRRLEYGSTCSYPWPMVAERDATGWVVRQLDTQPPNARPTDARWSELGVGTGASGEGYESWLLVATGGSGTWRGVLAW